MIIRFMYHCTYPTQKLAMADVSVATTPKLENDYHLLNEEMNVLSDLYERVRSTILFLRQQVIL